MVVQQYKILYRYTIRTYAKLQYTFGITLLHVAKKKGATRGRHAERRESFMSGIFVWSPVHEYDGRARSGPDVLLLYALLAVAFVLVFVPRVCPLLTH